MFRNVICLFAISTCVGFQPLWADDIAKLVLTSPLPNQVIQREGFEPGRSHEHNVTGPELGYADIDVRGTRPAAIKGEP